MSTRRLSNDIARVVRGLLAERRVTVQEFAATIGHPNSSVARWINQGGKFNTDVLEDIAEGLSMDVADLVQLARITRSTSDAERADLLRAVERHNPPAPPVPPITNDNPGQTGT